MLVEQDDTGTQGNPDTGRQSVPSLRGGRVVPNIDRGVKGRLGMLRFFSGGVDGGQGLFGARDLAGGPGLFAVAHGEEARLIGEEALEIEGLRCERALTERRGSHERGELRRGWN